MTSQIISRRYFTAKSAAVQYLNSTGWQKDPDIGGNWFRYHMPEGYASKSASIGRSSKTGLWVVNFLA